MQVFQTKKLGFEAWDIPLGFLLSRWPRRVSALSTASTAKLTVGTDADSDYGYWPAHDVSGKVLHFDLLLSHLWIRHPRAISDIRGPFSGTLSDHFEHPHAHLDWTPGLEGTCAEGFRVEQIDHSRGRHQTCHRSPHPLYTYPSRP
jgi:hypothetical protein